MTQRTEGINLYCPVSEGETLRQAIKIAGHINFPVDIHELADGDIVRRDGYSIQAFSVQHGRPALGYVINEDGKPGVFNVAEAKKLGVPPGPMFGLLQKGKSVTLSDGRVINPSQVMGESRKGAKVVISGDTTPSENTINAASGADIIIHESTFIDGEEDRAAKLGHSTSRQAAEVAKAAGAKRLILTHFSKRHSDDVSELVRQAKSVFEHSIDACDGMEIKI